MIYNVFGGTLNLTQPSLVALCNVIVSVDMFCFQCFVAADL